MYTYVWECPEDGSLSGKYVLSFMKKNNIKFRLLFDNKDDSKIQDLKESITSLRNGAMPKGEKISFFKKVGTAVVTFSLPFKFTNLYLEESSMEEGMFTSTKREMEISCGICQRLFSRKVCVFRTISTKSCGKHWSAKNGGSNYSFSRILLRKDDVASLLEVLSNV